MSSWRQSSHDPTVAGLTREWFMFVLVGGGAAGLYVLLATLLDVVINLAPAMASAIAYGVLVVPAYAAQRSLTFRSSASHLRSFPRYLATQLIALSVASIISASISGLFAPLTYCFAGAGGAVVSYCLLKFWGFSDRG